VLIPMAEFDQLMEPDELRYELDEGELMVMTRPSTFHNDIAGNLFYWLKQYLKVRPIGKVLNSDQLHILGLAIKRAPDVSVVLKPRMVGRAEELDGAPDLAVEVVSPSDFWAGCRVALVVYPDTREIEIWIPPGAPNRVLTMDETLSLPDLLPDWCSVSEVFRED